MDPKKVYRALYKEFGPQGWWPIKNGSGKFEIMVGAILTQNTAWGNVEKALANLRAAGALRPEAIVRMPLGRLQQLIRPTGYFRQKAKKLKIFVHWFKKHQFNRFRRSTNLVESTRIVRRELLGLWGIGPETADSILLYAFGRPVFVVDAYTRRFCAAHGVRFKTYDEFAGYFNSHLAHLATSDNITYVYQEFHALIVAWGKKYGKPARKFK